MPCCFANSAGNSTLLWVNFQTVESASDRILRRISSAASISSLRRVRYAFSRLLISLNKGFKKSFYWYIGLCVVVLALLIFIEVVTEANVFANIIALLCGAA